jgi:hypothetical protein
VAEVMGTFAEERVLDSVEVLLEVCVAEVAQGDEEQVEVVVEVEGGAGRKPKLKIKKTWRISYCLL